MSCAVKCRRMAGEGEGEGEGEGGGIPLLVSPLGPKERAEQADAVRERVVVVEDPHDLRAGVGGASPVPLQMWEG